VLPSIDLNEVAKYIDWTYFFMAWKISGRYPQVFDDPVKGAEARKLFDEAQEYIREIISRKIITCKGVVGLFPAVADGDDVKILSDHDSKEVKSVFRFLRNQEKKENGVPNLSLSDYVAPQSTGLTDNIGAFVVTAEIDKKALEDFTDDDYGTIMVRILSDRFAEAAAEWLHEKVRKEYWGYNPDENLSIEDILKLKYSGVRPAPGYPACPDHTEKRTIFSLLNADENIGAGLTENFAMIPAAAVSGYYFSHPGSVYFNIGKIGQDQLADYAERKGMTLNEAARWLAPNL
jgi:5-methyltetrahydrofolate--homocysteine methyltransferase